MPLKKTKHKPPSRDRHLQDAPSSTPSTSQAEVDEGKSSGRQRRQPPWIREFQSIPTLFKGNITTVEIQMTTDEVGVATILTFFMRNENVIRVHLNDALPKTHSSSWNCTPICFVELTTKLCKALCQFDNKAKRYYNACLSWMENGNLKFVFGHAEKDEALNMKKNQEVVKDMMEDLFKQIDVKMTSISISNIDIQAPPKNPITRESSQQQKTAGRSHDREQKPDNSEETAPMRDVTVTGVGGTGTANRSVVGGTQKIGKMIQVQDKMESKSFQIHGKIRQCRTKVTRSKDGNEIEEMYIQFKDEDGDETYNSTCKTEWTCEPKPDEKVLNADLSPTVMEPLYELKDSTRRTYRAKLKEVQSGSIVFVFEHETGEDALQMIKRQKEVKHLILNCLRQLDSEVEELKLHIKLQDLSQSERKVDTTESRPMKRKRIISDSISTEQDCLSADTSDTSSGENNSLKRERIISDSISTEQDCLSADTSETSSGEHMPHDEKRKLKDWQSSRYQTYVQPIPHPQTSAASSEENSNTDVEMAEDPEPMDEYTEKDCADESDEDGSVGSDIEEDSGQPLKLIKDFKMDPEEQDVTLHVKVIKVEQMEEKSNKKQFMAVVADATSAVDICVREEKLFDKFKLECCIILRNVTWNGKVLFTKPSSTATFASEIWVPENVTTKAFGKGDSVAISKVGTLSDMSWIKLRGKIVKQSPLTKRKVFKKALSYRQVKLKDDTGSVYVDVWGDTAEKMQLGKVVEVESCKKRQTLSPDDPWVTTTTKSSVKYLPSTQLKHIRKDRYQRGTLVGIDVTLYMSCPTPRCFRYQLTDGLCESCQRQIPDQDQVSYGMAIIDILTQKGNIHSLTVYWPELLQFFRLFKKTPPGRDKEKIVKAFNDLGNKTVKYQACGIVSKFKL